MGAQPHDVDAPFASSAVRLLPRKTQPVGSPKGSRLFDGMSHSRRDESEPPA